MAELRRAKRRRPEERPAGRAPSFSCAPVRPLPRHPAHDCRSGAGGSPRADSDSADYGRPAC
eukprot:354132-Chlamydomonas_euryale.AAC.3